MSNLQQIITKTKFELKTQETQIKNETKSLENYVDSILSGKKISRNLEMNENLVALAFSKSFKNTENTLQNLNSGLKDINSADKHTIIDAILPISNIITNIKNLATLLINAQNKCALQGDFENADRLAKISLEVNYENHMFVKNASKEIKEIKQSLNY